MYIHVPYFFNQTQRLLLISSKISCGIYSRAVSAVLAHTHLLSIPKVANRHSSRVIFNVFNSLQPKCCFKITPSLAYNVIAHAHFIRCSYNLRVATNNASLRVIRGRLLFEVRRLFEEIRYILYTNHMRK